MWEGGGCSIKNSADTCTRPLQFVSTVAFHRTVHQWRRRRLLCALHFCDFVYSSSSSSNEGRCCCSLLAGLVGFFFIISASLPLWPLSPLREGQENFPVTSSPHGSPATVNNTDSKNFTRTVIVIDDMWWLHQIERLFFFPPWNNTPGSQIGSKIY